MAALVLSVFDDAMMRLRAVAAKMGASPEALAESAVEEAALSWAPEITAERPYGRSER